MFDGTCEITHMDNVSNLRSEACWLKPRHHFDYIGQALMTTMQIVTTDNWPWIMWDVYLAQGPLALFFFPSVIVIGNLVALNLFLSIVVSTFINYDTEMREAEAAAEKEAQKEAAEALKAGGGASSDAAA
eukprot:1136516-Prymnesium_polylepis.1